MAEKTKFWYLKHFNIFEGMNEKTMMQVDKMSSMITCKTHDPIYFPNESSNTMFFLKEGHVKISRLTSDGKEIILDVIGPGEVFGELPLGDESENPSELAEALDTAIICTMKKQNFEMLLQQHPELNFEITKRIGLRLKKFQERVTDLAFKDVKKRIASFLVKYADEFGKVKGDIITIQISLSHQEIALLTGSARQTVTTTLNEFRSNGIIDFSRQKITIKRWNELQLLAK